MLCLFICRRVSIFSTKRISKNHFLRYPVYIWPSQKVPSNMLRHLFKTLDRLLTLHSSLSLNWSILTSLESLALYEQKNAKSKSSSSVLYYTSFAIIIYYWKLWLGCGYLCIFKFRNLQNVKNVFETCI